MVARAFQSSQRTRGLEGTSLHSEMLENPVPHIQEAKGAAARIVSLQRELFTLKAEHAAITQAKRIGYGIAAALSAFLAILFSFGWLSYALYERGIGSIWLATGLFVLFGGLSALAVWAAWKKSS